MTMTKIPKNTRGNMYVSRNYSSLRFPTLLLLLLLLCFSSVSGSSAANATSAPATNTTDPLRQQQQGVYPVFTFGYLRMSLGGIDSPNSVAGFLAYIRYLNKNDVVPDVRFELKVTTIPCETLTDCRRLSPDNEAIRTQFIKEMGGFTAVLKPNSLLAAGIIDEAKRLGGLPVIAPSDVRMSSFLPGSENVINFAPNWQRQAAHLFTYMQQTGRCAQSGIFHGRITADLNDEYDRQISNIQKIFEAGDYETPPFMQVQTATDAELHEFFLKDSPRRRCFLVLGTHALLEETLERLSRNSSYDSDSFSFYGVSMTHGDDFSVNGSSSLFANTVFTHWLPTFNSPQLLEAFADFTASVTVDDLAAILPSETFSTSIRSSTYEAYMALKLTVEAIRSAIGQTGYKYLALSTSTAAPTTTTTTNTSFDADATNTDASNTKPLPMPWEKIVDAFYRDARTIDGHLFAPLVRRCPAFPARQMCFCNVQASTSYIYGISGTTGLPYNIYDDEALGQRDISTVSFNGQCGYNLSSWSYPITGLALYPSSFASAELSEIAQILHDVFSVMTRTTNYQPVAPTRPLRYAFASLASGSNIQGLLKHYLDTIDPFVIYGTMEGQVRDAGNTLTLSSSFVTARTEDPPLAPHGAGWRWNTVQLHPSLADYIHSLVSYYHSSLMHVVVGSDGGSSKATLSAFTSVHAIASTQREAELISMSFATFNYLVPVESIVVSEDPQVWVTRVTEWLTSTPNSDSARPFVLAATTKNNNSVIEETVFAAAPLVSRGGGGTLALACPVAVTYKASTNASMSADNGASDSVVTLTAATTSTSTTDAAPPSSVVSGDIIFGSFKREWWLPSAKDNVPADLLKYVDLPRYHTAMLYMELSKQLYSQVYYDYKTTAAQVLYKMGVVTAADSSFGPFYNASCTPDQIARNERDRQCQCTKGIRTIFVLSLRDLKERQPSARTGNYAYTMTTCGLKYSAYVPPPQFFNVGGATISSGAIAGIAVGSAAFVVLVLAALLYLSCSSGRNNSRAPKDPSVPFAIVFTDIQSSTALWARAPSAMSEAVDQHHALMRRALARNSGYEVKTVGDSFMVAFKHVDDAVRFALDAQMTLHESDWNEEIDATYNEMFLEAEAALHNDATTVDNNNNTSHHDEPSAVSSQSFVTGANTTDAMRHDQPVKAIVGTRSRYSLNTSSSLLPPPPLPTHPMPLGLNLLTANSTTNGGNMINGDGLRSPNGSRTLVRSFSPALSAATSSSRLPAEGPAPKPTPTVSFAGDAPQPAATATNANNMMISMHPSVVVVNTSAHNTSVEMGCGGGEQPPALPAGNAAYFTQTDDFEGTNESMSADGREKSFSAAAAAAEMVALDTIVLLPTGAPQEEDKNYLAGSSNHGDNSNKKDNDGDDAHIVVHHTGAMWRGLRVRIGVHYGLGDIRKDPISQGYDYYGTVVNTAARVEGVGHGGQTLLTQEVVDALESGFATRNKAVVIALGPQPLRGLDEPIRLFQMVPQGLEGRKFPPLRLHIEKEDDDDELSESSATAASVNAEEVIAKICMHRQYASSITPAELLDRYYYLAAIFAPTPQKFRTATLGKLGVAWGFEKAEKAVNSGESSRIRLLANLIAKITRTYNASRKVPATADQHAPQQRGVNNATDSTNGNNTQTTATRTQQHYHHTNTATATLYTSQYSNTTATNNKHEESQRSTDLSTHY